MSRRPFQEWSIRVIGEFSTYIYMLPSFCIFIFSAIGINQSIRAESTKDKALFATASVILFGFGIILTAAQSVYLLSDGLAR